MMGDMDFLEYWGLRKKPFENTGDPEFFYYSAEHKEALVRLIYVIKQNKAGALLAGDYGTGKTTIANELLYEIEVSHKYESVYISNPMLNSTELLQEIVHQMGKESHGLVRPDARRIIEEHLREVATRNDRVIIIVDEAHLVTQKEVLEELRLLMNLQYRNQFLTTLIMMGQLELRDVINAQPQFKQRFAMCYILNTLSNDETSGYIKHRLKIAGSEKEIFDGEATTLIFRIAEGRPRQINNICDMALLVGSIRQVDKIGPDIIKDVGKDLGETV